MITAPQRELTAPTKISLYKGTPPWNIFVVENQDGRFRLSRPDWKLPHNPAHYWKYCCLTINPQSIRWLKTSVVLQNIQRSQILADSLNEVGSQILVCV